MKKVFIYLHRDVCERRPLDANKLQKYLSKNGCKTINNPKDADVIIFITCGAFNAAVECAFKKIKEFQDKYDAELIVAGCIPDIEKEKLAKIFDGRTISTKDLDDIGRLFPENKIKFSSIEDANIYFQNSDEDKPVGAIKKIFRNVPWGESLYVRINEHVFKHLFGEHSILYQVLSKNPIYCIRISWGCMGNCSYCVIKKGVGPLKSKPLEECVKEFKKGLRKGYKKILITGDDVGPYGLDIGSSFPELLDKMTKIPGEYEISIRAFGPQWTIKYVDELEEIVKRNKIRRVDVNIQAGSPRICKLMNRCSDMEKMKDTFLRLKSASPCLSLFTHILVGFPTETKEEFEQTLQAIKEMKLSSGALFPYSTRAGSKAENIEPKVPQKEISRRLRYAKKFLKKEGYNVIFRSKPHAFVFAKQE